jgi:NADPH:quinone reductase
LKAVVVGEFGGPEQLPCILGYDIAGVVDSTGPGVTGFRPGDRVMAMTHFPDGAGGYAELAVVDAGLAAPIGPAISMAQAAAAPLAAGTAWTILARLALRAGSRLLVLGASGGVGLFLYTSENLTRRTRELAGGPVDAVADLVGGRALAGATGALRTGGQAAAIATPELDLDPLLDANITFHGILIQDDGQRTREIAALLASGTLHPVISHQLPLAQAARAHRILQGQHPGGKIVLTLPR